MKCSACLDPAFDNWKNGKCPYCGHPKTGTLFPQHNTDQLTDIITNAIDLAIRDSKCDSYSDWQALIHALLTDLM